MVAILMVDVELARMLGHEATALALFGEVNPVILSEA